MNLKDILSSSMWNAGVAIGTITLAIATFISIHTSKKEREARLSREVIDKIYTPLIKDLTRIRASVEEFKSGYTPSWRWENFKEEQRDLVYGLPAKVFDHLEEFTLQFRRYENLLRQREVRLIEIVEREEKKKVPQFGSEGAWGVCFHGRVGGKFCQVDLFELLFRDETFDRYLERFVKENPDLPNRKIEGDFMVLNTSAKLSKKDFEEIDTSIKRVIDEDSELKQLLNEGRALYENAGIVENKLTNIINRILEKIS